MIGLFLVTSIAAGILGDVDLGEGSPAGLINVLAIPLYLRDLIFLGEMGGDSPLEGVEYGGVLAIGTYVAVLLSGIAVLLWRYRWVER